MQLEMAETYLADTLRDYISYIFDYNLQNICLCARRCHKMELIDE